MVLTRSVEDLRREFFSVREELTKVALATARPEQGVSLELGGYGWNTTLQSILIKGGVNCDLVLASIPEGSSRDELRRSAESLRGAREPQARHNAVRRIINGRFPGLYEMMGGIYHSSRRMTAGGVPLTEFDLLWVNPAIVDKEE